ncbi:30S ribosomal protein S4 [Desulfallas thermosapovorans]|uniref:Small ribosomal subunit protein uS4 n=1 Tax=Desulfallas thermosapovorans DSM 6562 TaxID=1121431 RepID=A0A5S4ZNI2_9FIRM|nr:30S ribosomal protein S4 [Desulfallas thermosapovorans]TYO93820.1 small subunit ribosomal protein S4 [Desulfallas thermosapovorans DSM 6562]
MARYTGAQCKLCRREGQKLYLKGDRCYTGKCGIDRRSYAPGQHGQSRKKISEYGLQLREKQKARRFYGILEKQFRNYYVKAARQPGVTGENLLRLLERRLDNVVYRLGLAASRNEARQLVRHGHFVVNGRKTNIPSFLVRVGDEIVVREKSKESPRVKELIERAADNTPPAWLEYDAEQLKGRVVALPSREQIDAPVQETLIVELYSK